MLKTDEFGFENDIFNEFYKNYYSSPDLYIEDSVDDYSIHSPVEDNRYNFTFDNFIDNYNGEEEEKSLIIKIPEPKEPLIKKI